MVSAATRVVAATALLILSSSVVLASKFCVVEQGGVYSVVPFASGSCSSNAPLTGEYNDTMHTIGWDVLKFTTNAASPDKQQAYAAGFFEGYLTAGRTESYYNNLWGPNGNQQVSAGVLQWLQKNLDWMQQMIGLHAATDKYWYNVDLVMQQFRGLKDGLNSAGLATNFTDVMVSLISSAGDLLDLDAIYPAFEHKKWQDMTPAEFNLWFAKRSHCSALIKVTPGQRELYMAHSTWQNYQVMNRIYKIETFNFNNANAISTRASFSSYPGTLSSTDDYYVLDSGLTVIETTLDVFNLTIYDTVTHRSLLSWMRVLVANRMSASGEDWYHSVKRYNSGTYNNQWMVVNWRIFTPEQDLVPGTLWVVEQMPGLVVGRDMTSTLQFGYWPSYNVAAFKEVFEYAGYPAAIAQQGPQMLDYQTCVRAQMFREYQTSVTSISQLQWLMQYNNYMYEPISMLDPVYSIAARGDLMGANLGGPQGFGAIDSKVANFDMAQKGQVLAYCGPTPQQAVFEWANFPAGFGGPHVGVPAVFNFSYVMMS